MLGLLLFNTNVYSENKTIKILSIGDSHFCGSFGRNLHRDLSKKYEIYTVAVGGAGSYDYTKSVIKNNCCGYNIRYGKPGYKEFSVVEHKNFRSNEIIWKEYKGNLLNIIQGVKPDVLIISLGTNRKDAHKKLINLVRKEYPDIKIIWIGPPKHLGSDKIYIRIKEGIDTDKKCYLIRSDNIKNIGNPSLPIQHYTGPVAVRWASIIDERIELLLSDNEGKSKPNN